MIMPTFEVVSPQTILTVSGVEAFDGVNHFIAFSEDGTKHIVEGRGSCPFATTINSILTQLRITPTHDGGYIAGLYTLACELNNNGSQAICNCKEH